jgi:succinyl-CoA synthetase beta subunit
LLDEAASLALLAKAGVSVVKHALCHSEQEAASAFTVIGANTVVVKGCTEEASHKSELGLVRLGVRDEAAVRQAFKDMHIAANSAGIQLTGVIVAEQVKGQRELMIGARVDPVFGPVVLVGDGGKYVEAMPDLQVLMAPFSAADVERALGRLRIAPLLAGVRGEPPLDVHAFCQSAMAVGQLMADEKSGISQLDINPVMVGSLGQGCVCLDAVIYRKEIQ